MALAVGKMTRSTKRLRVYADFPVAHSAGRRNPAVSLVFQGVETISSSTSRKQHKGHASTQAESNREEQCGASNTKAKPRTPEAVRINSSLVAVVMLTSVAMPMFCYERVNGGGHSVLARFVCATAYAAVLEISMGLALRDRCCSLQLSSARAVGTCWC